MRSLIYVAYLLLSAWPASPCSCRSLTACDLIERDVVFTGEAIEGGVGPNEDAWYSKATFVRFKVIENFRGLPEGTKEVTIHVSPTAGMCSSNPYSVGNRYLVAPGKLEGELWDGGCFIGRNVEDLRDDMPMIRDFFAGKMPRNVHGRIGVARERLRDSHMMGFLFSTGETKPIPGVNVTAVLNGETFRTTSDAEGRYTLNVPSPGEYEVRAGLAPYSGAPSARINLSEAHCEVYNIGLGIDNTITGSVVDETGQPVMHAKVGLIDLDRPASANAPQTWFAHEYMEQPQNVFHFENVPEGRFLLIFNPEGPRVGRSNDVPLEGTYYPAVSRRSEAKVIEVKGSGVHLTGMNIVAGKKASFRRLVVKFRSADGQPTHGIFVKCVGPRSIQDQNPWELKGFSDQGHPIELLVPTDRSITIEARSEFSSWKESATHPAGASAIEQEFVVPR